MKRFFILTAVLFVCIAGYAFFIEPYWLEVTHHSFHMNIPRSVKVAHLTDLHLHEFGRREAKILEILSKEKPDLIVLTGDTLDDPNFSPAAFDFLSRLSAPMGVWAIKGNWEHWKPVADENAFYERAGAKLLVDETVKLDDGLTLIGLDDVASSKVPGRGITSPPRGSSNCIQLFHSPEMFEEAHARCGLSLAGHTHGGQAKLPFLRPFWLPHGSGNYVSGWYEKAGAKMYVSRGIGTSVIPARLFARPEVAFITIGRA